MMLPLSAMEAEVWEYTDRVVAHCVCNLCGGRFSLTLRANPTAIFKATPEQIRRRIFKTAWEKHDCDPGSYKQDPAETGRIVNKWHETKRKLLRLERPVFLGGKA